MGTHVITVPDVGEGIAEVELVSWSVAVGDPVTRNQILAEVMTDKANVEIPAPRDGVIATLNGEVGTVMAVGSPLIELTIEGAVPTSTSTGPEPVEVEGAPLISGAAEVPPPDPVGAPSATSRTDASSTDSPSVGEDPERGKPVVDDDDLSFSVVAGTPDEPGPSGVGVSNGQVEIDGRVPGGPPRDEGARPLATPAVRHRARQGGIDLRRVPGTGPAGRITHEDLDAYWHGSTAAVAPAERSPAPVTIGRAPDLTVDEQPIIGMRRQIAKRMLASTQSIPHITYVEEVDMTALEELRSTLNEGRHESQPRLTLLPFLIRAMVDGIASFPQMNAHVDDAEGTLTTYGGVHVGIATQTDNGLVVPVIRHAEASSIWDLATRLGEMAAKARDGKATAQELSGSTITITSLGSLGGLVTTPVINKPEVAIVGVNKLVTRPVYVGDALVPRKIMNLSSSFDHRIIDGWDAASFIQRIRRSLEQPALLFIDAPSGGR